MIGGDKNLDSAEQERYDEAVADVYERVLDQIPAVLSRIPDERFQESIYDHAFSPDSALSAREQRPHLTAAYVVEHLYLGLADEPTHRETLLQLTVIVQEYYDILDDVVDADLEPAAVPEATVVTQALFPVVVDLLADLPDGAATYWSDRAIDLSTSWWLELDGEQSSRRYREVLDRQSNLYGFVTGLAAVAAGADEDAVADAEALGRAVFKLDAAWLDLVQHKLSTDADWNVYELHDVETVTEFLEEWAAEARARIDSLATDRTFHLRAPLAEEFDEWYEKYPAEDALADANARP